MYWFRSLFFLTSLFFEHTFGNARTTEDTCISEIDWRELWKYIDSLNPEGLSQECLFMNKSTLCDPADITIRSVSEDAFLILQILGEIAKIFKRKDVPFPNVRDFLEYNYATQNDVKSCQQSQLKHHLTSDLVKECFRKMNVFLNQDDKNCTWQVVHYDCLVILQQLEYYIATSQMDRAETNGPLAP